MSGAAVDVSAVTDAKAARQSGVAFAEELIAFVDAAVGDDRDATAGARNALREAAGPEALVDAAAVAANFQRMVRIADGSGIPLDTPLELLSASVREDLALDAFASDHVRPSAATWKRLAGRALAPLLRRAMQLTSRPKEGA
jgi:hypothetical protein